MLNEQENKLNPGQEAPAQISTELGNTLNRTQGKQRTDASAKEILSYKVVAANILKNCVPEFRDVPLETIITDCLSPVPMPDLRREDGLLDSNSRIEKIGQEFGGVDSRTAGLDIRFMAYTPSGNRLPVQINFEPQAESNPKYPIPKRGFSYLAHMYTTQLVRRTDGVSAGDNIWDTYDYNAMRKVYSIWIMTKPAVADRNSIVHYSIQRTVTEGNCREEPREDYDVEELVKVNLGSGFKNEEPSDTDALSLLTLLFRSRMSVEDKEKVLQDKYRIAMSDQFKTEVGKMGSLADVYFSDGYDEGYDKGYDKGQRKERVSLATRMLRMRRYSYEEIAEISDLPLDEVESLAKELDAEAAS